MSQVSVWALIGGFFALMVAQTALVLRLVRNDVARITGRLERLDLSVQRLLDGRRFDR